MSADADVAHARWFLAGYSTGEHAASTLEGTFAAGFDAGYAAGLEAGRRQLEAELEAQHAAWWQASRRRLLGTHS